VSQNNIRSRWTKLKVVSALLALSPFVSIGIASTSGAANSSGAVVLPSMSQLLPGGPANFSFSVSAAAGTMKTVNVQFSNASTVNQWLANPGLSTAQRSELEAIPTSATDTVEVLTSAQAANQIAAQSGASANLRKAMVEAPTRPGSKTGETVSPHASETLVFEDTPSCNVVLGTNYLHTYTGWTFNPDSDWYVTHIDASNMYTGTGEGYSLSAAPTQSSSWSGGSGNAYQFAAFTGTHPQPNESFSLHQSTKPSTVYDTWTVSDSVSCT
jgi:hypothetical protein